MYSLTGLASHAFLVWVASHEMKIEAQHCSIPSQIAEKKYAITSLAQGHQCAALGRLSRCYVRRRDSRTAQITCIVLAYTYISITLSYRNDRGLMLETSSNKWVV